MKNYLRRRKARKLAKALRKFYRIGEVALPDRPLYILEVIKKLERTAEDG